MNLKEAYAAMGANYDDVIRRLVSEDRVLKFLSKLPEDKSFQLLDDSIATGNYGEAFRAAHSLKGICMNLGLSALQASSSALTENLRGGKPDQETMVLYEQAAKDFHHTIDTIRALLSE